jgi:hypothetical protein
VSDTNTDLSQLLVSRLSTWEDARKPQELTLLNCYQDYMRIARDDDTAGTATAKTKKAKGIFIGSTRMKVRAAHAKIIDSLIGNGQLPFDTTPANDQIRDFSDVMEEILRFQLDTGGYKDLLSGSVSDAAVYGTTFTTGVHVREETHRSLSADNSLGINEIKENVFTYELPYFELCSPLDCYPDPEARRPEDSLGFYWVRMMPSHVVASWAKDKSYSNIDKALKAPGDDANTHGSELASEYRANVQLWFKGDRIKVAVYFGKIPRRLLKKDNEQAPVDDPEDVKDLVDVIAIVAGGVVVKVNERPACTSYYKADYENTVNEMWGVGVAENNFPHQKITNAAFRLVMEGKGMALLGTKAIDRSKFLPSEDFKKYPGKVYNFKPGLSPDEKKASIIEFNEPDITNGWMDVINMSQQFSDDDTGITKYQQGDQSGMNKTATGISMIMGASSLPLKEVIRHFDMMIEKHVESLIEWNLKYLEVDTVQAIFGDEVAQKWAVIKQFGKASFMDWQATGTSTFMQKEILVQKLQQFSAFALSNPEIAQNIDTVELLKQTWDAMEIGKESPIKDPNDAESGAPPPIPPEAMQQAQMQIEQMGMELQKAQQQLSDKQFDQQIKLKELEIKDRESQIKVMQAQADIASKQSVQPDSRNDEMSDAEAEKLNYEAEMKVLLANQAQEHKKELMVLQARLERMRASETDEIGEDGESKPSAMASHMDKQNQAIEGLQAAIATLITQMSAPKVIIKDASGRPVGIAPANQSQTVVVAE